MWIRLHYVLTICQVLSQISALSSTKTIHLPPASPDDLYLGCYEQQNNDSSFYQARQSIMSPYKCIQACAEERFPLAAVFNETACYCANDNITTLLAPKNNSRGSSDGSKIFHIYNTSCFFMEIVELYQELTFTMFQSKITPSLSSSISPVTLVNASSVRALNLSEPILYSVDFDDGGGNKTLQSHFVLTHRFVTTGEFNVTLAASRYNSTIFISSRTIRVISRIQVTGMDCPAVVPLRRSVCTLFKESGSDVTVSVTMNNTEKNVSLSVPDVTRMTLGKEGFTMINQSDSKDAQAGTYVLPSLEFSTDTSLEAWELYAEYPGHIRLQIYSANWNLTNCAMTFHQQSNCGDWVVPTGHCDQVCISVSYCQRPLPISSCAHRLNDYFIVNTIDVNLTVGYNLIVIPEEERFIAHAGDIVGFQKFTSGAVLQRITAGQTPGVYYIPVHNASTLSVRLESMVALNISFHLKLHGSVRVKTELTVSCFQAVGMYPITVMLSNAILTHNNSKALTLQSVIAVQNKIREITLPTKTQYIVVNTTKNLTASVLHGTNVTCEWSIPNAGLFKQSPYLVENATKEGAACQLNFTFLYVGSFPVVIKAYNLVSKRKMVIHTFVRELIRDLKVEMCYSSFAYDNALTCYNSSVTSGTDVGCRWSFNFNVVEKIAKAIYHKLTPNPDGYRNFTLYCKNRVPQYDSVVSAPFSVQVIANPLSIDAPLVVPANTTVKITCHINWPGGSPASFFAQEGVSGKKGTDVIANTSLTLQAYTVKNSSVRSVTLYKSFRRKHYKHKVWCKSDTHLELNTFHQLKAMYSITGIDVNSSCPGSIEISKSCSFEVQIALGDSPNFSWTVIEGDTGISVYKGRKMNHRFASIGMANVTVNVSNVVSSSLKTVPFDVYSHFLNDGKLHHAASGLVGQAITFSVSHVGRPNLLRFLWNWMDQSPLEEGGPPMTHNFTEPGQYFISVNISSGIHHVVLRGHVTVQHPLAGLLIRDMAVGSSNILILEFEIFQGNNVTYSVDYGDGSDIQKGFLSTLPQVVSMTHQYSESGTYNLSISANSVVGPSTSLSPMSVKIVDTPCVISELRMLAAGENSSHCPEIRQEYEYSLHPSMKINCSGIEEIKYKWKVEKRFKDSVFESVSFHNEFPSSEILFLPAQSLRNGLYKFTLSVTAKPLGISKAATGFLRVRMPKLLANIDCGSEREMLWNQSVVLNGSASHDPNDINTSSSLSFQWFCDPSGNVSCFKGKVDNKQPVLTFPPQFFDLNSSYEFVLSVTKGQRQAKASQIIKLVAGNSPPLCVRCKENCAYKLTTSKEFVLSSEGCDNSNSEDTRNCYWELYGPPSHGISKRSVGSQLISDSYSNQFKLDTSNLIPNQTYTIFFNNLDNGFSAQYSVTTDMPPSGGSCVVSPSEGVVIETLFRISCTGWKDEDSPLWYEYFFRHPEYGPMLLFYGWMPFADGLFLPPGLEKDNFNLDLLVKITDVLGSYTTLPLQVKVKSFSSDAGSVSSILKGKVSSPHSMLENLLAAGEFRQATQLMTTVITVLNQDSAQATDSLDTENRVEVRSSVIKELSKMRSSSPQGITQVLGGLLQAIRTTAELSPDALVDGANAFTNMAKVLVTTFKKVRADNTARDILYGLNNVLEASVTMSAEIKREQGSDEIKDWIDDSNEARNKDHQEKCERATNKSLEGVNYSAQKLLDFQEKSDPPRQVNSSFMTLTVTRQSPSDIDDAALDGGEVTFQLPQEVKKDKLDQLDAVNTKVITMSQTPFIASDVIPINTPVSTLELLETSGKEIEIRDLTEPVSMFLSLADQSDNNDLNNMTDVIRANENMTFFKVEPGEHNSLYFVINCSGTMKADEKMIVIGKRNSRPSNENYDLMWSLQSCNATSKQLLSRSYLNNSRGFYFGVKLFTAANVTNGTAVTSEIKMSVIARSVDCYYWNEDHQAWRTDGCEVGPLTTLQRIHCQCSHLTWFGSRVFVPPNTLHLDTIAIKIKDPSNYALVLAVLCTTCGLYLIVVVWARRQDRKDVQKTGMTVSPSNKPGDTHAYEVIISTGMRRHAGTTANVAMTMTGEGGESHAFLLKNSHCVTLARSSVNSFLVTTSESLGELSYIRVWHDNFGEDPAWYVKQISICEIATARVWHFICESWLAVDESDGLIDRIFPVTSNKEMNEFRRLFVTKAYRDLTDSHLWFSVVCRPPQSLFTRVQRVSCCFSLLLCTMMANAMWYEADKGRYTAVELGPFEFSWEQVSIGICSSLIVFPINLILVQIFRHCRPRPLKKFSRKPRESVSSNCTEISMVKFRSNKGSALGYYCPAGLYRNLNKPSPEQSPTQSSRNNKFSLASGMRSAHLASFSVSLGAATTSDSTNDIRALISNESQRCSPVETSEKSNTTQNEKRLPWWFVYVGWALVIITSLTAASVTLLYGIQFGEKKSAQWLLSMFFSVTQDIFVSQPIKVVGLAIFFAYIFKKPNTVTFSRSSGYGSDEQWLQDQLQGLEEERVVAPPVKVPSEDTLRRARDRAAKERAMHHILLDFGTYLVFLLLVLLIAYGFRDKDAFHQNNAVAKVVLGQRFSEKPDEFKSYTFSKILRQRNIWDWTQKAFLPTMYNLPFYFYTGKAPKFIEGESGLVVGVARLRQHRAKKDSCSVVPKVEHFFSRCVDEYDITSEDDQAYTAGWESLINNTELQASSPGPWGYSTSSDLDGYPYTGGIKTYSGGGYVLELSHIYYKAVRQIKDARNRLWLDHYTRSVFAEFTLYNPNSNLFCAATFLMETLPTGGVFPRAEVLAYRLYRYVGDFQLFILACEVFFFALVLYFTYREAKRIYKTRRKYLSEVWSLMDLTVLILCWIAIVYYFICLGLRKWTLNAYHKNPTKFISFQHISAWQLMFEGVVGVTVFVTCLKFIKLFRFNRRIFLLSCTLKLASEELIQYSIVFLINFLAFAQIYHFLLGSDHGSFSTLFGSMKKLLSVLLGKFNIEEMMNAYKALGVVIFLLYTIITNFLFLNVLIVIIIDSFKVIKQQNDQMKNEFELLEYIMARLKDILGIRTLNKTTVNPLAYSNNVSTSSLASHPSTRARAKTLEVMYQLDEALDNLGRYVDTLQDIENHDDMLCCYVSRRIRNGPLIKIESVDDIL